MFNILKNNLNINNSAYGGFVISKNVTRYGKKIKYSYREESIISELNGWTIYSDVDDDQYVNNPDNFEIVNATTIYRIAPVMLEIFEASYGTDLQWLYRENVHVGFFDLKSSKETTISEILRK